MRPGEVTKYWNERWKGASSRYDASWPDTYARKLELNFILAHLEKSVPTLELGCGPFTIGESKRLYELLHGRYHGIDSSLAAVEQARATAGEGFAFSAVDLEDKFPQLPKMKPPAKQVICRRVVQNLSEEARTRILRLITSFKFAIVIEGSRRALTATNRLRNRYSLAPLIEPAFNKYLSEQEEAILLEAGFERVPFMSVYYYQTRGCRQLKGWDTPAHEEAYKCALTDYTGELGPNVGFVRAQR